MMDEQPEPCDVNRARAEARRMLETYPGSAYVMVDRGDLALLLCELDAIDEYMDHLGVSASPQLAARTRVRLVVAMVRTVREMMTDLEPLMDIVGRQEHGG